MGMFNTDLPEGPAGYTVGVLCRGIERSSILRGQVICAPGATTVHTKVKANMYLAKKDEGGRSNPVMPGYMPVFYFRTCDVTGKIVTLPHLVSQVEDEEGDRWHMDGAPALARIERDGSVKLPAATGVRLRLQRDVLVEGGCQYAGSSDIPHLLVNFGMIITASYMFCFLSSMLASLPSAVATPLPDHPVTIYH